MIVCEHCGQPIIEVKGLTPEAILYAVSKHFDIPIRDISKKTRKRKILLPRQLAQSLMKEFTALNLSEIAKYFKQDHTTVIHSCKTIQDLVDTGHFISSDLKVIKEQLNDCIENVNNGVQNVA